MTRRTFVSWHRIACFGGLLLGVSCTTSRLELDLSRVDSNGLRGPVDGKVAVAYEFSIPDTEECRREVTAIDPTVQFMPGSRGRIGAGQGECLCIGSTHQKAFRSVLANLAALPYVDRIIECHFE